MFLNPLRLFKRLKTAATENGFSQGTSRETSITSIILFLSGTSYKLGSDYRDSDSSENLDWQGPINHTLQTRVVDTSTDESYTLETFEEIVGGDASVACARCNCNGGIIDSSVRCAYLDNLQQPETHTQCNSTAGVPVNPNQEDLETVALALKECFPEESNWESLRVDIQEYILRKLEPEEIIRLKVVSKGMKKLTESSTFQGSLTSLYLHRGDGGLQWSGFDTILKKWRPLPTLVGFLPHPDPLLLVSAGDGLLCVSSVSKSPQNRVLVVCNPMTRHARILPPLTYPRDPVLMHVLLDTRGTSYKVIVAGSAGLRNEGCQGDLSRKTEVFDSLTSQWEVTGDLPGVEFGLNEYQTGVCSNGTLYCIATLGDGLGKGVLAYNVEDRKWLSDWKSPLPNLAEDADAFFNAQLVECDGGVYLFSELQIREETVEHRIDKLENTSGAVGCGRWESVVREQKSGGRGLLQYPEYVCAGFGAGRLCIFNTRDQTGKVYDIHDGGHSESLVPSPQGIRRGGVFHSLNPLSFVFRPNLTFNISSTMRWPISLPSTESLDHETEIFELFPSLL